VFCRGKFISLEDNWQSSLVSSAYSSVGTTRCVRGCGEEICQRGHINTEGRGHSPRVNTGGGVLTMGQYSRGGALTLGQHKRGGHSPRLNTGGVGTRPVWAPSRTRCVCGC